MTSKTQKQVQQAVTIETDGKALGKLIKSIQGRGKALDKDLHKAAVSVLFHAFEHRNLATMQQLLEAMPESGRKGALRKWLFDLAPVMMKDKNFGLDADRLKDRAANMEYATATPFWKHTPDKDDAAVVDAGAMLANLLTKLGKLNAQGKLLAHDQDLVEKLTALSKAAAVAEVS